MYDWKLTAVFVVQVVCADGRGSETVLLGAGVAEGAASADAAGEAMPTRPPMDMDGSETADPKAMMRPTPSWPPT